MDHGPWTLDYRRLTLAPPLRILSKIRVEDLKRTPLLLTLTVLVLLAGGYYVYDQILHKEPVRAWDLVPARTVFVYEKDICNTCIDDVQKGPLWQLIQQASFMTSPADSLRPKLNTLIANSKSLLVSAHVTRKDDFDFIYYITDPQALINASAALGELKDYRYNERALNEIKIHELSRDKRTFSWIVIGDVWVGSFTPFLIEDVIRTHNGKTNFNKANPEVRQLPHISGDAGNLYIQLTNFTDWLSVFLPGFDQPYDLGRSSLLDIKSTDGHLVLNGFSTDYPTDAGYLLSIFKNQSPVSFTLKDFVVNRTVMFTSYGINDGNLFSSALHHFASAHKPHLRDSLELLSSALKFNWDTLYNTISNEIGVCLVEGMESPRLARILMIETDAPDLWLQHFNAVSERLSEDTVFYEQFSGRVIRQIPVRRFPEKLLWPLVSGFEETYYTTDGNLLFIGDNLEELKFFLEDIEHEDTWGKSVSKNQFMESTLLESNMSVFINTPKVWSLLSPKLNPRWSHFVENNRSLLRRLQMCAFQFSHLNNTYYTNIAVNHTDGKADVAFASTARRNVVHFSQPIQALQAVRSHVSQETEILIQDSLNDVSLVSMDGKVLWKLPIGDRITSDIQQVDFYNNGKLQYIFSTQDAIHIIDRLGNYVPPYPLYLKGKDIKHLSVVDYDGSKRYRFLVTEQNGNLWMYDKSGKNLEGWTPRETGQSLMAPARHHRIRGKDFIIAIRKDGLVNLYNRRGEMMENFPLDLQGTPMGDYFLEMGPDIDNSWFVVVTRDGFRVKFNVRGKIENRETLLRAYVGSQFSLISEKSNKTYLIEQHDSRHMTISNAAGKKLLSNDYISGRQADIQYYQYGAGRRYIALTDPVQSLSYVFDGDGVLLTQPPLEGTAISLRTTNSGQTHVFFIHGKTLTIQPLLP